MKFNLTQFIRLLNGDASERYNTINLIASENVTSPLVKYIIGLHPAYDCYHLAPPNDLENRYWLHLENPFIKNIRKTLETLSENLLKTPILDPRPKGGQTAEIAVLLGLARCGDTVFVVEEEDGGHFGLFKMAQVAGINLKPIIFDHATQLIDIDATIKRMKSCGNSNVKAIIVAQSIVLRKQNISELCIKVKEQFPDIKVTWDVSHILGLIMGGEYPNPLENGVDILHGSTHKTFPGPQKGILAFSKNMKIELINNVYEIIFPSFQSNTGTTEIFALAIAMIEMKQFGKAYAKAVCNNAKQLATTLYEYGFDVIDKRFGFTETHQVLFTLSSEQLVMHAFRKLNEAGIKVNPVIVPFTNGLWGFRLGVSNLTRRGLKAEEMKTIAHFIKMVILDNKDIYSIKQQTKELMSAYPIHQLKYTLELDEVKEHMNF